MLNHTGSIFWIAGSTLGVENLTEMTDSFQDKENSCVEKAANSPYVVKPKPLCFKKKPRRLFNSQPLGSLDTNVEKSNSGTVGFLSRSIACINPFKCVDGKRKRITDDRESDAASQEKDRKYKRTELNVPAKVYRSSYFVSAVVGEDASLGFDNTHFSGSAETDKSNSWQPQKDIPVDWSLKTKIRLISSKPFPWRSNFRTSEEASGTTAFARCLHSGDQPKNNLDSSHGARLYQQCLVWMHPVLPWLNLFPRFSSETVSNGNLPPLDPKYVEVLHSNWRDSFRSLYQLVRTCQCPYFYLCCSTFTVLFRSGGVGSIIDIHAAITPTSRGLRNALADEGIEFKMPLNHGSDQDGLAMDEKSLDCNNHTPVDCDKSEANAGVGDPDAGDAASDEEEEPGSWLESLGLSQQDFPSLNSMNEKRRKERKKNIDHRPESLVYVEGSETQGLVNFLLNYRSCVDKIGPMAGIPPTLISPVAFLNATLQTHKVQHAKVQEKGQELYAVELKGPLLPNAINSLCSLFNSTQDGNFKATLTPCQPTSAFARLPSSSSFPSIFATENLKDCGLSSHFIQHMCSKSSSRDRRVITSIAAENGLYSWT